MKRKHHRDRMLAYGYFFAEGADSPLERYSPVFWLEAAMVVAFAVSWLVKGEVLLADPPELSAP